MGFAGVAPKFALGGNFGSIGNSEGFAPQIGFEPKVVLLHQKSSRAGVGKSCTKKRFCTKSRRAARKQGQEKANESRRPMRNQQHHQDEQYRQDEVEVVRVLHAPLSVALGFYLRLLY